MAMLAKTMMDSIVKPALGALGWFSENVAQQIMGTAAQESQMGTYLKQIEGPALGIWQMEPFTHDDIHQNYLSYRPETRAKIYEACEMKDYGNTTPPASLLISNSLYACLMARVKYMRAKDPIPAYGDIEAQANNWKNNYNSGLGKGDTTAYMINYERFLKSYYSSL